MSKYSNYTYDALVCFGDSITQHGWDVRKHGWVAQLAQAYLRRLDIINRGFSGYNTRWAKGLIAPALDQISRSGARPRLVTVLFGANDAQFEPYKQHVPLSEFRTNLEEIADAVVARGASCMFITPPPLCDELWAKQQRAVREPMDRSNEVTGKYAAVVQEVAAAKHMPCIDLYSEVLARAGGLGAGLGEYLWDGLHLNANGNDLLFELVVDEIRKSHLDLNPDHMPFVLPDHRVIYGDVVSELTRM